MSFDLLNAAKYSCSTFFGEVWVNSKTFKMTSIIWRWRSLQYLFNVSIGSLQWIYCFFRMYRISERMCLVTVRIKLTAYNKRLVNPYVSIQIEKKIEILYDLKLKKNPLDNHQMAILLVLSKVSQDKILYHSKRGGRLYFL